MTQINWCRWNENVAFHSLKTLFIILNEFYFILTMFSFLIKRASCYFDHIYLFNHLNICLLLLFQFKLTGGALNPIRMFGPALITNHWHYHWVSWTVFLGIILPENYANLHTLSIRLMTLTSLVHSHFHRHKHSQLLILMFSLSSYSFS